ncbi:MAG TPA: 50S ribosomal protein L7Ae-like protein [Firmicutes bacterium]|nr:50S ribosomal protein L7Ae-like protein [Bacillota bacterium]
MDLEQLRSAKKKVAGVKQTLKMINRGEATAVFVAKDAEPRVVGDVVRAAQEKGIPLQYVETMAELGAACGITIGASCSAICGEGGA